MSLCDSHCHLDRLDLDSLGGSLEAVLARARAEGVDRMLCVAINLMDLPRVLDAARRYPEVYASVGVHPNEGVEQEPSAAELAALAGEDKVVAIGETGLDCYRSSGDVEWQRRRFRRHIEAARRTGLPLIVHTRDAQADTLRILGEEGADAVGGVMHCFTGTAGEAAAAMEMGFLISFSGIITFRNAGALREVAAGIPEDRLLVETDAPYLAPVPHRGKPNLPAYVALVAACVAEQRGVPVETLVEQSGENFFRLFPAARG